MKRNLSLIFILCFQVGCATYQHKVRNARQALTEGRPADAAKTLEADAFREWDDQLIYLLDYSVAKQAEGDYKESNRALLIAEKIADIQDYHSISRITGSLLWNEEMVQYKGEDFENVLINAYLAINFLMLKDHDASLVEARKLNNKLYKYKHEAKRDYDQNVFAHYLSAMIWEAEKNWDSAYIEYERAYKLSPGFPYIQGDLVRAAKNARRQAKYREWKKKFNIKKDEPSWNHRNYGELVIIYQQGWGPRKRPHPESPRFPKLYPTYSMTKRVKLNINQVGEFESQPLYNVEKATIKALNDIYGALVAKRIAGIATKAVVSNELRKKNQLLGDLAWIAMNVADRADLRQWSTLPETLQVVRVPLKPGDYTFSIKGIGYGGHPTGEMRNPETIQIKPGEKVFINWRSFM